MRLIRMTREEIEEAQLDSLLKDHITHVKNYMTRTMDERGKHFMLATRAWRELCSQKATGEAHRRAVNFACSIGKLRPHNMKIY